MTTQVDTRIEDYAAAGCTPAELLVIQRAAAAWAPSPDELALAAVADDAAYIRAYGARDARWLDQALRTKLAQVTRDYNRGQLRTARWLLGLPSKGAS